MRFPGSGYSVRSNIYLRSSVSICGQKSLRFYEGSKNKIIWGHRWTQMNTDKDNLTEVVIGAAYEVANVLGSGFLPGESL